MLGALSSFADLLPEAIVLVTGDGIIRVANRALVKITRIPGDELVGRSLSELVAEPARAVLELLKICSRNKTLIPFALTFVVRGEADVPCRCQGAVVLPHKGDAAALVLVRIVPKASAVSPFVSLNRRIEEIGREFARRARLEKATNEQKELFRVTLSSIGDGVITTSVEGLISFVNPVAEAITGWSAEDAHGRPLREVFVIVNEHTRAPVESPVDKVLATGLIVGLANHTLLIRRDGTERPIDDSGAPIVDDNGKILGVVLVFRDVTDRRAMEEQLRRNTEKLVEIDRRKDEFLAMLAHELRNPLASLNSGAHLLLLSPNCGESVQRIGSMMDRQVQHLAHLVDDLLDVSRITRGKIQLRKRPVPLRNVLESAVDIARPLIDARGHLLTVSLPPKSLWVDADGTRLSQVFANLLSNAAKFTEPRGAVFVTSDQEEGRAVVRVRDTGAGIPEDVLPKIFDLFIQADRSLARSEGGLGVGLTLARALTELHGGSIEAKSEGAGKGTELIVKLPCLVEPACSAESTNRDEEEMLSRRILLVDDNADALESLADMLEMWGHVVRTASTGPDALEIASAFALDVALLDIGLPGMDGYELAARLKSLEAAVGATFVAITGYGLAEDRERSRAAGFDFHLTKPVNLDALRALLAGS